MLISITHPQAFSSDLTLMGFDDAEFVLLYLARKMDSNDRYLPAARALVERCGATGTTASRLSPGVTARDIGARSSHREVKVGPLLPQTCASAPWPIATCPASVPSPHATRSC